MITDKSDTFTWQSRGINCCSADYANRLHGRKTYTGKPFKDFIVLEI